MDRQEFISRLTRCLDGMAERDEILSYYGELIDDGVESGKSEQEVIAGFAPPEEIARGVAEEEKQETAGPETADGVRPDATNAADNPAGTARPVLTPDGREPASALRVTAIVLLILCSPVIFSLFVSVYAVLVSLFASAAGLILGGGVYVLTSVYLLVTAPYVGLFQRYSAADRNAQALAAYRAVYTILLRFIPERGKSQCVMQQRRGWHF